MNQRVNLKNCLLQEATFESDSPFFGGGMTPSSACRRATLRPLLSPYLREPRIQESPISPATSSRSVSTATQSNGVLSSSAQRIFQALESMSTPVSDAKRIPIPSGSKRSTSYYDEDASLKGKHTILNILNFSTNLYFKLQDLL